MAEISSSHSIQYLGSPRDTDQALAHSPEIVDLSPTTSPHLLDYWNLILKRRWTVLLTLFIVFATVAIGTLKQRPVFEGKVVLEVNPEEPSILSFNQVVGLTSRDLDSYRETQYKVLQSRTLAERVIRDEALYRYPEFYRTQLILGLAERDPAQIPSLSDVRPPDANSEAYINSVAHFMKSVDVSPVRRSNLVEVSFDAYEPNLAAQVANKLTQDYIDQNLEVKWDETIKASEWLSKQLVGLKAKLEKSEESLQAYAQANSIVFLTDKQNLVNARLEQLQQEYTKAQADRYQKESLYSLVQTGNVQDLPGILSNGLIQNLSIHLAESERDYALLAATVKPEWPKAIALKKQIDSLQAELKRQKKALTQNIVDDYRAAVAREKYLRQAVEDQKKTVNEIAAKSIQYNIIRREVDTNRQLYEGLLQRMKEAQVSAGLKASNIRIVDSAEIPKGPVKPRVLLNLLLGVVFGTGLGIVFAFLQEYMDNTLKTSDEVEQLLRLPTLGAVPSFHPNGTAKLHEGKQTALASAQDNLQLPPVLQTDSALAEAYRSLRTSILLSAAPHPRVLLVTSALPGEGKTTTTINLGATLASLGSRVVIIDCDMRKPSVHSSAGVDNQPGFVRCLTGHVGLQEAVLPVPGVPNLSVIPCGPIPPNPSEILSSPITVELLRKLREGFDYVLIDSPPVLSVADSRILSTLTDAVVLVTRAHETPFELVLRSKALLYSAGSRILGVALNGVHLHREDYRFQQYYQYGGVYGEGVEAGGEDEAPPAL
jgi:polysaccharide biosynthesis transport protein